MLPVLAALIPAIVDVVGTAVRGQSTIIDGALDKVSQALQSPINSLLDIKDLTTEQVAALQKANLDFKSSFNNSVVQLAQVEVDDRKNARDLQKTLNSNMPAFLTIMLTIEVFIFYIVLIFVEVDKDTISIIKEGLMYILGVWSGGVSFWLGSSYGSRVKDFVK